MLKSTGRFFVLIVMVICTPGSVTAQATVDPIISISQDEITLRNHLDLTVPVISPKIRRAMKLEARAESHAPFALLDVPGQEDLDLDFFSHLFDPAKPSAALQRIAANQWTVTLAGSDLYAEKRTAEDVTFRIATHHFWATLIPSLSTAQLSNASLRYDPQRDRWSLAGTIAVPQADGARSVVFAAGSTSGDPTDRWRVFRIDSESGLLPIRPVISQSDEAPILSVSWIDPASRSLDQAPTPVAYSLGVSVRPKQLPMRSAVFERQPGTLPAPAYVTPLEGAGMAQQFSAVFTDEDGAATIQFAGLLINSSLDGKNSCVIYYDGKNKIGLVNDANTAVDWVEPGSPVAPLLHNSQCTLNPRNSGYTRTGFTLVLRLDLAFSPAYGGVKALYMYANDGTEEVPWQIKGYWSVPTAVTPPVPDEVHPASGYGFAQRFSTFITSNGSLAPITFAGLLINNALSGASGCVVYYAGSGKLGLVNDQNTEVSYVQPGTPQNVENSQCRLNGQNSEVKMENNGISLSADLTFKPAFGGLKNIYAYARNNSAESGWVERGSWGVPTSLHPPRPAMLSPTSGFGNENTFWLRFYLSNGAPVEIAGLLINSSLTGVNGCVIYYAPPNRIGLVNDTNTSATYLILGTNTQTSNSQCTLNALDSSVLSLSTSLDLHVSVKLNPLFAGTKVTYAYARDTKGAASGWTIRGNWTVLGTTIVPMPTTLTPMSAAGSGSTFNAEFHSPSGTSAVTIAGILVNASLSGANNCAVYYYGGDRLCLANDANTAATCVTVRANEIAANSQCTLQGAFSSISTNSLEGRRLTISPYLAFTPAFKGLKNVYSFAAIGELTSGWSLFTTYLVQ